MKPVFPALFSFVMTSKALEPDTIFYYIYCIFIFVLAFGVRPRMEEVLAVKCGVRFKSYMKKINQVCNLLNGFKNEPSYEFIGEAILKINPG